MATRPRRLFALDQNFPEPIVDAFAAHIRGGEIVPVRRIREDLPTFDDWQLMLELHNDARPWDGLITGDHRMLALAKEMTVLSQTQLTLVVVKGQGHNPVRAAGLLLAHLDHICHHTNPEVPQVWRLSVAQKSPDAPLLWLERIAASQKTTVSELLAQNKVPASELRSGSRRP